MNRIQILFLELNRRQTRALLIGIVAALAMGLFPPWDHVYVNDFGGQRLVPAGFGFIAAAPVPLSQFNWHHTQINLNLLLLEWAIAVGGTLFLVMSLRDKDGDVRRLMQRYR